MTKTKGRTVALALTWDGARWPVRLLPPKARAFLSGKSRKPVTPAAEALAEIFARDEVAEIRVCWVPRMKGGPDVLTQPFSTSDGKRLAFASARTVTFGDVVGVVYARQHA